ncbi:MAG: hypothetical protein OEZ13_00280 [Spirochaetia bacterium]|nr:hypothetical protein [Spirochaetia bacterium]
MKFFNKNKYIIFCASFLFIAAFQSNIYAKVTFKNFQAKLPSPFIKDIKVTASYFWIATAAGLVRYDISDKDLVVYGKKHGLPDDFITSIAVEPDEKTVWVGTPSGIGKLNTGTQKTIVYNKAKKNLGDDKINVLLLDKGTLYVGTQLGVDKFQNNDWTHYTAIEGLAGDNIQALAIDGDVIWAGGGDGISYYDKNDDFWISYDASNGLNNSLVTSLAIDADAIWVGTMGGGVSRFDKSTERFEPYTAVEGLADDYVQCLMDDGIYLWVGTFDGLSRLEKKSLLFQNFHSQEGIKEPSVYSGIVYGNNLYLGTDGGSIFIGDKAIPQVSYSSQKSGYKKKENIEIYGTILSNVSLSSLELSYKQIESTDNKWLRKGIDVESPENGQDILLGTISTKSLKEGKYHILIRVKDSDNRENQTSGMFIVDKTPPQISIFFRTPKPGEKEVMVSGRYIDMNLENLNVKIGNQSVKVSIDRQQKTFRFPYPIASGKTIFIEATDIAKNTVKISKEYMVDRAPPQLTVNEIDKNRIESNLAIITGTATDENLDRVVIHPGEIEAKLTPTGNNVYEFEAVAPIKTEGLFTFQVTAIDKAGRSSTKSTKPIDIRISSTIIEIEKDKIPEYTIKDSVEISGYVLGPLPKEIYLLPNRHQITIKKDKSFSYKMPLIRNEVNKIKLVYIDDKDEKHSPFSADIESGSDNVDTRIDPESKSFRENIVTIKGSYDRGIARILVNGKPVKMNENTRTYVFDANLKEGQNQINITTVDELGRLKKKKETVYLDRQKPNLFIRPLPRQTGLQSIKFKGVVNDASSFELNVFPSAHIEYFDTVKGEFEGILNLEKGSNKIFFIAIDYAGNRVVQDYIIQHDISFAKVEVGEGAQNIDEILELRAEIERLKKLLASGKKVSITRTGLMRSKLPAKPGLFLVPMGGKTGSYDVAAKLYLGNELYADTIAAFNGKNAKKLTKVLVPTPELFRMLTKSKNREIFEKIIEQTGRQFIKNQNINMLKKNLLGYLMRGKYLKNAENIKGALIFKLKNNAAVVLLSDNQKINRDLLKKISIKEMLIARVSKKGLLFSSLK